MSSLIRASSNMRLLAVSDLHHHLPWFSWTVRESPRFDAVIFAGDFVDMFAPDLDRQAAYVRQWLSEFPRPIFCATGNHDVEVAEDFIAAAAIANPRVHPDGTDMQIEEMRVVCVPWGAPPLHLGAAAAPVLLVTHVPPSETAIARTEAGDCGSYDILALTRTLPNGSLVVSGHAHTPERHSVRVGDTLAINTGMGEPGGGVPHHAVIDSAAKTVRIVGRGRAVTARW